MTYYSVDPGMILASATRPEAVPVYDLNGGTVVAIAGEDFCLVASDTRLGTGYSIYTRNQSKLFRLTEKAVLGTCGCWCDCLALSRLAEARFHIYQQVRTQVLVELVEAVPADLWLWPDQQSVKHVN